MDFIASDVLTTDETSAMALDQYVITVVKGSYHAYTKPPSEKLENSLGNGSTTTFRHNTTIIKSFSTI